MRAVLSSAAARGVVIIDGRSGSGKSTFARLLVERWPHPDGVQLLALDDVYPGWDGLFAGAAYAHARALMPWAAGRGGTWQRWDWARDRYSEIIDEVVPDRALVLEGSGALTSLSASLADVRVWLDAPADLRRERALARDGDVYRAHWDRWARQEEQHVSLHAPHQRATHVVMTA
ncbi:hypothetical protein F6B42_07615 [Microbacterium radiodurans]|uniref:ATP-binding protein n=1 Tax=Microbacterium radiodurans TaxID=661398 RepID=A0A5J5IRU6_9MICO|nr:hypothetical protein F6B42_07615 [Microbacterium radiodurans]